MAFIFSSRDCDHKYRPTVTNRGRDHGSQKMIRESVVEHVRQNSTTLGMLSRMFHCAVEDTVGQEHAPSLGAFAGKHHQQVPEFFTGDSSPAKTASSETPKTKLYLCPLKADVVV
ncbi:hypothetical protein AAFF_G00156110 [Aldrovandia affinis]|uniref:Uncharacterized protein n=1 Tax=Aldrovandia affinis TaxID=143900 RepID=A0AAD7W8N6_9TELE|nr:hypothetical protein AAFF_G00156110 [Aldrovandia affinis]